MTAVRDVENREPPSVQVGMPACIPVSGPALMHATLLDGGQHVGASGEPLQEVKVAASLVRSSLRPIQAPPPPPPPSATMTSGDLAKQETSPSKLLLGAPGFPCPIPGCPTVALTPDLLTAHQNRVHATPGMNPAWTEPQHKCPFCEELLPLNDYLDHVKHLH